MPILAVVPTQGELDWFLKSLNAQGHPAEPAAVGRLPVNHLSRLDLTVAAGGLGKTQFAVQTQHLVDAQPWGLVICAGAAGALAAGVSIGDVVVATETVEHDIRKTGRPLVPRFTAAESAITLCRAALCTGLGFQVHFGPVASGDEDIVDDQRRAVLHMATGALAVAWEGAGGARACGFSGVPFLEVRGVTDNADGNGVADFKANLAVVMRNVATVVGLLAREAGGLTRFAIGGG